MIQSVQVIVYGNQEQNYPHATKAEQFRAGKQLLISASLINSFGTSIIDPTRSRIDKVNRLLSILSSSRVTVF